MILVLVLITLLTGFTHASERRHIVIGTKHFSEQLILGELLAQSIEAQTSIEVERKFNLGGTQFAFEALKKGEIDLYPEYTGTGLMTILHEERLGRKTPKEILEFVRQRFKNEFSLYWAHSFGFSNSYALAVSQKNARLESVRTISDLKKIADSVKWGSDHEFVERPDGLKELKKFYDLNFNTNAVLSLDPGLMYQAIKSGEVDVIAAFATDGRIKAFDLRILNDDRHFFPPYDAVPLIRMATLTKYPELHTVLRRLSGSVTAAEMTEMNYQVDSLGRAPEQVAREHLKKKGLILETANTQSDVAVGARAGFFAYAWSNRYYVAKLLGEHLSLTLLALLGAILVGVPLGIVATRMDKLSGPLFGTINTFQTIPSLALLGFLIPFTGIGIKPAILALFLYALLPMVRNTYAGILEVDSDLKEASRGMGLTDLQILRKVEIPLALPMIMAGVRTSTVIIVGTATLAALIGAGGLGDPIFRGISSVQTNTILLGAIPSALLAITLDRVLHLAENRLISQGLRVKRGNRS